MNARDLLTRLLCRRRKPVPVIYDDAAKFAYVYPHLRTKEAS